MLWAGMVPAPLLLVVVVQRSAGCMEAGEKEAEARNAADQADMGMV